MKTVERLIVPRTNLCVSQLCLGTMNYGLPPMDATEVYRQLDRFLDAGGNFLDTAHVYNDWEPGERARSERMIGRYLRDRGRRDLILSTKGGHPILDGRRIPRLHRRELEQDVEESLRNLNVDTIDLYFLHRDDPELPVDEILNVLDGLVKTGKIRYYGCSNWRLERIYQAQQSSGHRGFVCNQLMWSLARINACKLEDPDLVMMDHDIFCFHRSRNMAAMAFSSQAKGYFSRLEAEDRLPQKLKELYDNRRNKMIYGALRTFCAESGRSLASAGLRWMMEQPFPAIPIVSCDNDAQLSDCLDACGIWGRDEIEKLKNVLQEEDEHE